MSWIQICDHTESYGKDWGSGRPVLLIHGRLLNAYSFDRTTIKLAEAGHHVINYDCRGPRQTRPDQRVDPPSPIA